MIKYSEEMRAIINPDDFVSKIDNIPNWRFASSEDIMVSFPKYLTHRRIPIKSNPPPKTSDIVVKMSSVFNNNTKPNINDNTDRNTDAWNILLNILLIFFILHLLTLLH